MTLKPFLKRVGLKAEDFSKIKETVVEAEKTTNGEIAVAIIRQSNAYSAFELFWAFVLGILSFCLLIIFAEPINAWINTLTWTKSARFLPSFFIIIVSVVVFVFFLLLNIPALDRLIIPSRVKQKEVYCRALRHFVESGVYKTIDRSGVLIFISVLERRVIILADDGISAKIEQSAWAKICNALTESIKEKNAGEGICQAIKSCGELLSQHFPAKNKNPNELNDGLMVLNY